MRDGPGESPTGDSWELPDDFVFDEAFVKGGVHEPPARTRESIAKYGGERTSWRHGGIAATPMAPSAPPRRRRRLGRGRSIGLLVAALVVVTSVYFVASRTPGHSGSGSLASRSAVLNFTRTSSPSPWEPATRSSIRPLRLT